MMEKVLENDETDILENIENIDIDENEQIDEFTPTFRKTQAEINDLVLNNIRFANQVANSYKGNGMAFEDLLSEARRGFIVAAEMYDETKGVKFISYAVHRAKAYIIRAICKNNNRVHVSLSHLYKHNKLNSAILEWKSINPNTEPSIEWLSQKLKFSKKCVSNTLKKGFNSVVSVHDNANSEEDGSIENKIMHEVYSKSDESRNPEDIAIFKDDIIRLSKLLKLLPQKEQIALKMKFFQNATLEEIAKHVNQNSPAGAKTYVDKGLKRLNSMLFV